jgi:hypothetical protein
MNVSSVKTKEYENKRLCRRGEKQTQSNPTCSELVEPIANQPPHFSKKPPKNPISLYFPTFLLFFSPLFLLPFPADAPACDICGSITVRNATCYRCYNCGNSMGCS